MHQGCRQLRKSLSKPQMGFGEMQPGVIEQIFERKPQRAPAAHNHERQKDGCVKGVTCNRLFERRLGRMKILKPFSPFVTHRASGEMFIIPSIEFLESELRLLSLVILYAVDDCSIEVSQMIGHISKRPLFAVFA